jgi:hypothetical protein
MLDVSPAVAGDDAEVGRRKEVVPLDMALLHTMKLNTDILRKRWRRRCSPIVVEQCDPAGLRRGVVRRQDLPGAVLGSGTIWTGWISMQISINNFWIRTLGASGGQE